jgi:hypothetical protein
LFTAWTMHDLHNTGMLTAKIADADVIKIRTLFMKFQMCVKLYSMCNLKWQIPTTKHNKFLVHSDFTWHNMPCILVTLMAKTGETLYI